MISKLFKNSETRRILIYLGAAGICALIGGGIYAAAINAVTPTVPYHAPVVTEEAVPPTGRTVSLKGETVSVRIADTAATREQGLSGRMKLGANEGMLFIFPTDGIYAFWMKDMLFSIDIVWISKERSVVSIAHNVAPNTYPNSFTPDAASRYVLELPAGWATSHNLVNGDKVELGAR